jgi:oligopeptide transport system substrate-binding protein
MTTTSRVHWWTALALSGAVGLMLVLFFGPRRGLPVLSRPAADENVLRVAFMQDLSLDPQQRSFPLPVKNQLTLSLWEPLVECDPETGQPQPAAAESWYWSADRLTLTLKLRADGRWTNGDPVTAQDFVRAWRRLLKQEPQYATVLFPLKNAEAFNAGRVTDPASVGMEAVDDLTLRLTLATVRSTLVTELADPLLVPLHVTTPAVLAQKAFVVHPEQMITNGAFTLARAGVEGFRLGVSPYFHDRSGVRLAGVRFVRVDNLRVARMLLAAGRVDLMAPIPDWLPSPLPTDRPVSEAVEMALTVTTMDLNTTRPPLGDLRVRRALSLALDRAAAIPENERSRLVPAFAWVPDMPGRPGLKVLHEDATEARRLLAEAGYPGGQGFPVLSLPVSVAWRNEPYLRVYIDTWYRVLGVRTYPAVVTSDERHRRLLSGDYDVFYNGLQATVPDAGDMLGSFALPLMYNASRWESPEVRRLLAEADTTTGTERLARLEQTERLVLEALPTVPTMFEQRRTLLAAEIDGWYADPLGRQSFRRLAIRSAGARDNGGPRL